MRACPRQHLRRIPANEIQLLACPDGAPRVCGHAHANICAGYLLMRFNCWRALTEDKGFAGMSTPTRSCPSLRKECLPYTKGNPREKSEEPKSVNCPRKSRHMGMKQNGADNTIRIELFLAQMFNEEDARNYFFFTTGRNNGKIVSGWYSLLKLYRKEKK